MNKIVVHQLAPNPRKYDSAHRLSLLRDAGQFPVTRGAPLESIMAVMRDHVARGQKALLFEVEFTPKALLPQHIIAGSPAKSDIPLKKSPMFDHSNRS